MSPAHLTGAERWGAIAAPSPLTQGSRQSPTLWSWLTNTPGRRSPDQLERGGLAYRDISQIGR